MTSIAAILIDGSILEGGGQLLRNSVALSALLSKPISVHKIRCSRKPPGLRKQHEAGIKLAADICSASLTMHSLCSIDFVPGGIELPGHYSANPGTAASTSLLLQVSLPCLLFSGSQSTIPSTLSLQGGTNATAAPQIDYTQYIFFPFLRQQFGIEPTLCVSTRGYFPRGGGKVFCSIPPVHGPLPSLSLTDRGTITSIKGRAHVGGLPYLIAHKMRDGAREKLINAGYNPEIIDLQAVRVKDEEVVGSGGGIVLWAETSTGCLIGGSSVSSKGIDPADVGATAAAELHRNLDHGGCVDEFLQDQIIIFMALAEGKSIVRTGPLTSHTKTAIWVAELLTNAKFEIHEASGIVTVTCQGIGFKIDQKLSVENKSV